MEIDRRAFIASLGGTAAVSLMDSEAKADSLEHWMEEQLDEQVAANQAGQPEKFPTVAEIEAQNEKRDYRRRPARCTPTAATQSTPSPTPPPPPPPPPASSCRAAATSRSSSRCRRIRRCR